MPIFGSGASIIEQEIEKATQETIVKEDVSVMFEICDRVNSTQDGTKEAYRCLVKRMQNSNPRVALMTLTLLDICVMNCGKKFHLEICSRDFTTHCKSVLTKGHHKVQDKLKFLLCKWAANEFKADPQLAIVDNFIQRCKMEGVNFDIQEQPSLETMDAVSKPQQRGSSVAKQQRQEDDDLAKAIELSLQETKKKEEFSNGTSSGLYPSMNNVMSSSNSSANTNAGSSTTNGGNASKAANSESRKVRALYDFEAAEENELSFKAGEIIIVLEDRDPNWWKGSNHRGEGLFPSNFVSSDLDATPEEAAEKASGLPSESELDMASVAPPQVTQVDESKMDALLQMLHDADPTALQRTEDDAKMESLEAECALMNPLIDAELEKIDRKHASLSLLSRRLNDALATYHNLLQRQPPTTYAMGLPGSMPPPQMGVPYYPTPGPLPPMGYPVHPGMPAQATMQGMLPPGAMPGMGPPAAASAQHQQPAVMPPVGVPNSMQMLPQHMMMPGYGYHPGIQMAPIPQQQPVMNGTTPTVNGVVPGMPQRMPAEVPPNLHLAAVGSIPAQVATVPGQAAN